GNDATVAFAGSQGDFELNVMMPVIARNLLESIRILANVARLFADRCIAGIEADEEVCRYYAEASPSIVTPLNRYLGYEEAAAIAKQALASGRTIRDVVIERGHVAAGRISESQLDDALDVLRMTRPYVLSLVAALGRRRAAVRRWVRAARPFVVELSRFSGTVRASGRDIGVLRRGGGSLMF